MRKVTLFDLHVGSPLAWDLVDHQGNLLLRRGHVLTMPQVVERLIERGAYIRHEDFAKHPSRPGQPAEAPPELEPANLTAEAIPNGLRGKPVFVVVTECLDTMRRINRSVGVPTELMHLCARIRSLAELLIEAHDRNADDLMAALHLAREPRDYRPIHLVLGAAVALRIVSQQSMDAQQRLSLTCAALTRDLGLLTLDAEYGTSYKGGETEHMRKVTHMHPVESCNILRAAGCRDMEWLNAVLGHHELLDGTGYPRALKGDAMTHLGRVLAVADAYAAVVVPGGRAPPMLCGNAIRNIFTQPNRYDQNIAGTLYKVLTLFPPGTAVKLESGEVAVVRHADPLCIFSLFSQDGMPRLNPIEIQKDEPGKKVAESVFPEAYRAFPIIARKLWD